MPSNAYTTYLVPLLADATELNEAHRKLRTGAAGRQWGLGALNRAVVVTCLSAWEAYVEEIVKEAIGAIRPTPTDKTLWQSINADARSQINRFNTPNVENVRRMIADTLGLQDVTQSWWWRANTLPQVVAGLSQAITFRHDIAHGVNPRPTIHSKYARKLPPFFLRLGLKTDGAVRDYLIDVLHAAPPWPS